MNDRGGEGRVGIKVGGRGWWKFNAGWQYSPSHNFICFYYGLPDIVDDARLTCSSDIIEDLSFNYNLNRKCTYKFLATFRQYFLRSYASCILSVKSTNIHKIFETNSRCEIAKHGKV